MFGVKVAVVGFRLFDWNVLRRGAVVELLTLLLFVVELLELLLFVVELLALLLMVLHRRDVGEGEDGGGGEDWVRGAAESPFPWQSLS